MTFASLVLIAALTSALAGALVVRAVVPPARSLRSRLQPYLAPTATSVSARSGGSAVWRVFAPIVHAAASSLGQLLDRSGDEMTVLKLRQTGWYRDLPESEIVGAYRMAQLRLVGIAVGSAVVLGQVLGFPLLQRGLLVGLGLVVGATRLRGKVNKAIDARRETMRIEIYTINQLLAMRVRAGGGVVQAVQATVRRGQGEVVAELADVLRLHRAGWRAADAFRRMAELTPEAYCSRTYRLLASAEERGADLAGALLDLSEDVRESRRESIKRSATKRRAAMLVPTIAILAPVLILFVAAPLPFLITGWNQ